MTQEQLKQKPFKEIFKNQHEKVDTEEGESNEEEEKLHMLQDKYKINIYLQDKYPHDPGGRDICHYQIKEYLEHLYENMNILFNNKFPTDLHTEFQIIKLLIEKGNLNLIHNQNSYQHFNSTSRKTKLDKLYNEM